MNLVRSLASRWQNKQVRLIALLVAATSLVLVAYVLYHRADTSPATNKAVLKTSGPGKASDLLPVTTTPSAPSTSPINSPSNSGQGIQSQPNSTPNTDSPQQAAPTTPEQVNEPATTTPTQTVEPRCSTCGGGFRKAAIACPMNCVE